MKQTTKTKDRFDMRRRWLRESAEHLEETERFFRSQLAVMKGTKPSPYKRAIKEVVEAHKEAAAVYRRRIEELR